MNRDLLKELTEMRRNMLVRIDQHSSGEWCNGFDTATRVHVEMLDALISKQAAAAVSRGNITPNEAREFINGH